MPLYDVEHVHPLSPTTQADLAQHFASLHATRFHTPSFFINVRFHDLNPAGLVDSTGAPVSTMPTYRGGRLVRYNRVIIRTRVSENRSKEVYDEHCRDVVRIWNDVVGKGEGSTGASNGVPDDVEKEWELRTVWVMGALTTAVEAGFERPTAGTEIDWLRKHKAAFQKLADAGDVDFQGLMEELKFRTDFKAVRD